jgi:hypothetical protein
MVLATMARSQDTRPGPQRPLPAAFPAPEHTENNPKMSRKRFDVESNTIKEGNSRKTWILYILIGVPVVNYYLNLIYSFIPSKTTKENIVPLEYTHPIPLSADFIAENVEEELSSQEELHVGDNSWSKWIDTDLDQLVAPELGCGNNWQQKYANLHSQISQLPHNDPNRRLFIFDATCCGLSDRLQSLMTAFSYALLTNRAIKIKWGEQGLLEQVYFHPYVNWTHSALDDVKEDTLDFDAGNTRDKAKWFHDLDLNDLSDKRIVRWTIAAGQLANLKDNPLYTHKLVTEYGFKPHAMFKCFFNYLLRPKLEVMKLVEPQLRELGTTPSQIIYSYKTTGERYYRIGLQIRMGDAVWDGESDRCKGSVDILTQPDTKLFLDCAKELERNRVKGWNPSAIENVLKKPGLGGTDGLSELKREKVQWYLLTDCAILRYAVIGWVENMGGEPGVSSLLPLEEAPPSDHGEMRWQQRKALGQAPKWENPVPRQIITVLDADSIHHIHHDLGDATQSRFLKVAVAESWLFALMDSALVTDWSTFGRVAFSRSRAFGGGMGRGGGLSGGSGMWQLGSRCSMDSELPWDHVGI